MIRFITALCHTPEMAHRLMMPDQRSEETRVQVTECRHLLIQGMINIMARAPREMPRPPVMIVERKIINAMIARVVIMHT